MNHDYANTMEQLDELYDLLTLEQRQALVEELKRVVFGHSVMALPDEDQEAIRAAGRAMIDHHRKRASNETTS
jgi:hypothetical protein